ncbi:MAG: winged helix DNA-binding domain-containing protein [Anaerolineae bacterium]
MRNRSGRLSLEWSLPWRGLGMSSTEVAARTAVALHVVLDGRALPFRQLSTELAQYVARDLTPTQLAAWQSPSMYAPDQILGEAVVHFCLRLAALQGVFCFAPRAGREACFVRTDQWLGAPLPQVGPDVARAELARRYLRCYGPSTPGHLSEWAGISVTEALRGWALVEPELVEVTWERRPAWLLAADIDSLHGAQKPSGVRLLPPHDPYLAQRDRATLLPERSLHRQVWRRVGNPGVALVDGEVVALWRPRKQARRLIVTVEPLAVIPEEARAEIATEANRLAPFRGCVSAETLFTDRSL